jgi:hypothetical protein
MKKWEKIESVLVKIGAIAMLTLLLLSEIM